MNPTLSQDPRHKPCRSWGLFIHTSPCWTAWVGERGWEALRTGSDISPLMLAVAGMSNTYKVQRLIGNPATVAVIVLNLPIYDPNWKHDAVSKFTLVPISATDVTERLLESFRKPALSTPKGVGGGVETQRQFVKHSVHCRFSITFTFQLAPLNKLFASDDRVGSFPWGVSWQPRDADPDWPKTLLTAATYQHAAR